MQTLRFLHIMGAAGLFAGLGVSAVASMAALRTRNRAAFLALMVLTRSFERFAVVPAAVLAVGTGVALIVVGGHDAAEGWLIATYVTLALMAGLPSLLSEQAHETAITVAARSDSEQTPPDARAPLLTPTYRLYWPLMLLGSIWIVALMVFRPF
ncbi:MAG: DUF2269 family protein [Actinobacteria bacterium]|nr:DUF2269 family protein [Actinomycetota bacterium]